MPETIGPQWDQLYEHILASNTEKGTTSYIAFEGEEAIVPEVYRSEGVEPGEPGDYREPVKHVLSLTHAFREGSNEVGHFRAFTVYPCSSTIDWDRVDQDDGERIEFEWSDSDYDATLEAFTEKLITETSDKLDKDRGGCVTAKVFWSALDQLKVDGAAADDRSATESLCKMLLSSHFAVGGRGRSSMAELLGSTGEIGGWVHQWIGAI